MSFNEEFPKVIGKQAITEVGYNEIRSIKTVAIGDAAGTGYLPGEIVDIVQDGAEGGKAKILTVDMVAGGIVEVEVTDEGAGYSVNDVLTVVQEGGALGTLKVTKVGTKGYIMGVVLKAGGTGYAINDVLTIVKSGAAGGTVKVKSVGILDFVTGVEIEAAGTGYSVNDVLTVVQEGGSGCTLKVTKVTAVTGAVEEVSLLTAGKGYAVEDELSTTVAPNNGSGCKINVLSIDSLGEADGQVLAIEPVAYGHDYAVASTLATTGGNGTNCTVDITKVGSSGAVTGEIQEVEILTAGSGYTSANDLNPTGGNGTGAEISIVVGSVPDTGEPQTIELEDEGLGYVTEDDLVTETTGEGDDDLVIDITADSSTYKEIVDLGNDYVYSALQIVNTTDGTAVVKLDSESGTDPEIKVLSGQTISQDEFYHNGKIYLKFIVEPTEGSVTLRSW